MKLVIVAVLLAAIIISHEWVDSGRAEIQRGREEVERKLQQEEVALGDSIHEIRRLEGVNSELLATKQQLADVTQRASTLQDQLSVLQNRIGHSHSDSEVDELKRQLGIALATTLPPHPDASLDHAAKGFPSANAQSMYQNKSDAFSQTEANEPPDIPSHQIFLKHIQQAIENGAKASDILSDPYLAQQAKNDPAFQELLTEADRRNGK